MAERCICGRCGRKTQKIWKYCPDCGLLLGVTDPVDRAFKLFQLATPEQQRKVRAYLKKEGA